MKRLVIVLLSMSTSLAMPIGAQASVQRLDARMLIDESGLLQASPPVERQRREAFGLSSSEQLLYSPSADVSASLRRQLVQRLSTSDPEHAATIASTLASDAIWRGFADAIERNGGSARNLADVMAAYYVVSWEIVHREEAGAQRFQSVRRQFAAVLMSKPELIGRSDAQKQQQAEDMGIQMALFSAAARQMLDRGDESGFATIQDAVRYAVLARDGIDLKQLKLTARGLSPS